MKKEAVLKICEEKKINVIIADTFMKRFLGLMGRKESNYALLLSPCNSVHTCFMRFQLDLLFLDGDNRIIEKRQAVKPWRGTKIIGKAHSVLEFPSSLQLINSFSIGMKVDIYAVSQQ